MDEALFVDGIFVNYRTQKSDWSPRTIEDHLKRRFGDRHVFFASRSIQPGERFDRALLAAVDRCDVLIAIIDQDWATAVGPGGRSIDDPEDWVRREIRLALELGKTVIPVYINDARRLDPEVLPEDIQVIASLQSVRMERTTVEERMGLLFAVLEEKLPRMPSPYRGLVAFTEDDHEVFAGRSGETRLLLDRVRGQRVVFVEGGSGSGKSSLVRAGLVPNLRAGGTRAVVFETNNTDEVGFVDQLGKTLATELGIEVALAHDVSALAAAVGDDFVLCVDQFEQSVLTRLDDARELFDLAVRLTRAGKDIRVVFTVRSSGDLQELGDNARTVIESGGFFVPRMNDDELAEAIREPARRRGRDFEPGLVSQIVRDAAGQAAQLPLVEFMLKELWLKEPVGMLTFTGYEELGGVTGALRRNAQERYDKIHDPAEAARFRRFFTQLAKPRIDDGMGYIMTETRLDPKEPQKIALAEELSAARLVVIRSGTDGRTYASIAHESLIHQWDLLAEWLHEWRDFRTWEIRLNDSLVQWDANGRDRDGFLHGAALITAQEYMDRYLNYLGDEQRDYIRDSTRESRRVSRRRRNMILVLVISLFAAATIGVVGYVAGTTAIKLRDMANSRNLAAAVQPLRQPDSELAAQVSVAAYQLYPTPDALGTLLSMASTPNPLGLKMETGSEVRAVAYGNQGKVLAAALQDGGVALWDLSDPHTPRGPFTTQGAHNGPTRWVAMSDNGRVMATCGEDGRIVIWDTTSPEHATIKQVATQPGQLLSVSLSPDGRLLAVGSTDHTVRMWSIDESRPPLQVFTVDSHTEEARAVFNRNGSMLATFSLDGAVALWHVGGDGKLTRLSTIHPPGTGVLTVEFSNNGRLLATGTIDHRAALWDISTPQDPQEHREFTTGVYQTSGFAFSPDDNHLGTTNFDGALVWWDITDPDNPTSQTIQVPSPTLATGLVLSPDGRELAVASMGYAVRLWDPTTIAPAHPDAVLGLALDHRGDVLASAGKEGDVKLWRTGDPRRLKALATLPRHAGGVQSATFSPDDSVLVVTAPDQSIQLWNVSKPDHPVPIRQIDGIAANPAPSVDTDGTAAMFAPDGRLLVAGVLNGQARLWTFDRSYHPTGPILLEQRPGAVSGVAFGHAADGRDLLVLAGDDGIASLWDVSGGHEPAPLRKLSPDHSVLKAAVFSPDGSTLAFGGESQHVWLWDLTTMTDQSDPITRIDLGDNVSSLAFSDNRLAIGTSPGFIGVWDVTDPGKPAKYVDLQRHYGDVRAMRFGAAGDKLFSGGMDRSVHYWELDPDRASTFICGRYDSVITERYWTQQFPAVDFFRYCPSGG